jgi:hypothetical protein
MPANLGNDRSSEDPTFLPKCRSTRFTLGWTLSERLPRNSSFLAHRATSTSRSAPGPPSEMRQRATSLVESRRMFPLIRSDNAAPSSLSGSTKAIRTVTWRASTSWAASARTNAAPHFIHLCPERARMRNVPCIAITSWTMMAVSSGRVAGPPHNQSCGPSQGTGSCTHQHEEDFAMRGSRFRGVAKVQAVG